ATVQILGHLFLITQLCAGAGVQRFDTDEIWDPPAPFSRIRLRTEQYIDAVQQGWNIDDAVFDFSDDEQ
ncbi:hypothetical protein A2U01_0096583, partial [Trifolium medium]|nr:hypothetical protein [Trifolium medium]